MKDSIFELKTLRKILSTIVLKVIAKVQFIRVHIEWTD